MSRSFRKIILTFLPLFLLYSIVFFVQYQKDFYEKYGDQDRYIEFADNLTNGFYTDPNNVDLTNGPGYPFVLIPFRLLNIPLVFARFLNVFFLFGIILYLYYTLRIYINKKSAIIGTYLFALYPLYILWLPLIYTEIFSTFLMSAFIYQFCIVIKKKEFSIFNFFLASFFLAFLTLTRTIFGYILFFIPLVLLLVYIFQKNIKMQRSILVFAVAIAFCLPYLIYTYSLTGKVFYWSTNGGEVLYWISSPFEGEYGDWFSEYSVKEKPGLRENHGEFFKTLEELTILEKDDVFRKKAIENIINHPQKYVKNVLANVGRILFNYPNSYTEQKLTSYFYFFPNFFIIFITLISFYSTIKCFKNFPVEFLVLLLVALIYFGISSLVSGNPRYFPVIIPILFVWNFYNLMQLYHIRVICENEKLQ